ncbi:short-chain dehydrogenase, partial [Saccharibacillus sp. O23]|uniref:SDR family NAD(P)-dependent oxidoreductase n=1 Tax=Saccharibacillus sp. O23 TaxID=2009338 RepID=UPI000B642197
MNALPVQDPNTRTALITGANNGIGLELTRRLLNEGWQVAVLIRSSFPADDDAIASAIRGGRLRIHRAELTDFRLLAEPLK